MSGWNTFFSTYGAMLGQAILIHLGYVLVSVAIGFVLGLTLGILLSRLPKRYAAVLLPLLSVFQTIPGIVFIGLLFLALGMTPVTVIIALAVYAMFPVLKNTYTGLQQVAPSYLEAARGCGMSPLQTLWQVELPLAMPTVIAGLRMSTIYTVSWAVLASMIGLGGLGDFIYQGVASNNNTLIVAGAIPAAVMAVVLGALVDRLQKRVIPRGMRKGAER
jgi:osmoprotectant transport system permease protein